MAWSPAVTGFAGDAARFAASVVRGARHDGLVDVDPAPVWPAALRPPTRPPLLVFLDMNHWIGLAKAGVGHAGGDAFSECLAACRWARASAAAVFPLSGSHYIEMAKIKDPAQRRDLAAVMEELSGFASLLSRPVVMRLEIETVLDSRFDMPEWSYEQVDLVGHGFGPAFGRNGRLRMSTADGVDITDSLDPKQKAALGEADLLAQRAMLAGPDDAQLADLRKRGWNPEAALAVAGRRAAQERELVALLDADPRWRRGRLRDVVAMRETVIELFHMLEEAVGRRGLGTADLMSDRATARALIRSMPSSDIAVDLKTQMHRNGQRAALWSANDVYDMDALALAIPYCDVVVTEKHAADALRRAGAPDRYGTVLLTDLPSLARALASEAGDR